MTILASLLLSILPAALPAEKDTTGADNFYLDEVVVTGTRTPKILKDTPIQTRLIHESDIRRADATDLQDLLQYDLPGIEFSYAMNQQVNMNLAGFSGHSVLILMDGERLAGETMENTDFARLTMENVARVEIVKGAASALYGSNAAGGVINIISKEAEKPWSVNLNARAADHNEWRFGAVASCKKGIVSNSFDFSFNKADTYTVCLDPSDECDFRHVYGHKTWNFKDRLTLRPRNDLTLSARAGYYFKERYYNPDTPDRYRDFTGGLKGTWTIDADNYLEVAYAFDQYDKSDLIKSTGLDIRDYRNVQNSLRALFNHTFSPKLLLTAGADVMYDYLDSYQFAEGETESQVTADIFAQGDWNISPAWEIVGAARWDYFSDKKISQATAKLSARYRTGDFTFRAGYAGGFRAPSLKEKYMDFDMAGIFDIHGNPDLKPEKSQNLNISAEYTHGRYNVTAGASYSFVDNKISTSGILYAPEGPYINYVNVPSLHVLGLEATAQARWDYGLSAKLSYAYTHEQTRAGSVNQYCPARPHNLNAQVSWHREWAQAYATTLTVSGRFLSAVSYESMYMYEPFEIKPIRNPAYTLWKVQLVQQVWEKIDVTVAVDNIFNYAPAVYSYNAPVTLGANLQIGLGVRL